MSTRPRSPSRFGRAFSLVETVIASVIVATMFAAGLAAAGAATRDRRTQNDMRTGQQLARQLMNEVCAQRYASQTANTIAHWTGISTTDRSNWTHVDDYFDFSETSPRDRSGVAIPGTTGWKWQASVAYQPVSSLTGAGSPPSGGGGLIGIVTGVVGLLLGSGTPSATDTTLKCIVVTVTSPAGTVTTVKGMRFSAGSPDRVSTGTGFHAGATYTITVGRQKLPLSTGINLGNNPSQ